MEVGDGGKSGEIWGINLVGKVKRGLIVLTEDELYRGDIEQREIHVCHMVHDKMLISLSDASSM